MKYEMQEIVLSFKNRLENITYPTNIVFVGTVGPIWLGVSDYYILLLSFLTLYMPLKNINK